MWDKVKSIIGSAAPMVGTLIGGPAGTVVGGMVASLLGVENDPIAIEAELRNNPEALVKIKQMESVERIELKRLMFQHAQLEVQKYESQLKDVQHARTIHSDHWMPSVITLCTAAMVCGMFASLVAFKIPEDYSEPLMMIVGAVLCAFSTAIAFWLGSSKGSSDKNKQLGVK